MTRKNNRHNSVEFCLLLGKSADDVVDTSHAFLSKKAPCETYSRASSVSEYIRFVISFTTIPKCSRLPHRIYILAHGRTQSSSPGSCSCSGTRLYTFRNHCLHFPTCYEPLLPSSVSLRTKPRYHPLHIISSTRCCVEVP